MKRAGLTHGGFYGHFASKTIFFFNAKGLWQRLDYVAIGPTSHYCFDQRPSVGFVFPTLRRLVQRSPSGPLVSGPRRR
jgi:hypothetical protein